MSQRIYLSEVDFSRLHELSDDDFAEVKDLVRSAEAERMRTTARSRRGSTEVLNRAHRVFLEDQRRAAVES